ncbi:MAG: PQQ-binding-like beta-propeller repeat protein, partial [Acidimicrobiales bacterium]|nr:PQQ-binding-like beta-propeller repeat protein [Acidimicrobiales bacterium]
GALDLDEDHGRFFTCSSCGTSLEDSEYGRGSPQVVNVTVAARAPRPMSRRGKLTVAGIAIAFVGGIIALAALENDEATDRDRITLGSIVEETDGDGVRVLATGRTVDGVVRAVFTTLDGDDGWSVDVADTGSAQARAALGDRTAYLLLERQLVGLSTGDGSERFRVDLPNDLACPDCMVASGDDGRYATVSLNGGTIATYSGDDGSLVSETDVGTRSYSLVVAGETVAFVTGAGGDVAFADPADLPGASPLELSCPPPFVLPDEIDEGPDPPIGDILVTAFDGDAIVQYDDCLGRWSPDSSAPVWRSDGLRPLHAFAPDATPDIVRPTDGDGNAVVDLADGSIHPIDVEPTAAQVIGRTDDTAAMVVNEDGVWSVLAVDLATGAVRWRKTPPGDFSSSYRPGILQELGQGSDDLWIAGAAGPTVHRVSHDADRNLVTVQQIDVPTGEATDEVTVPYADPDAFGVRLPVILGFTDVGVVISLDDRISHVDTATGEILAEG